MHADKRSSFAERHEYYYGAVGVTDWRMVTRLLAVEEAPEKSPRRDDVESGVIPNALVLDPRHGVYSVAPGLAEELARKLAGKDDARSNLLRGKALLMLVRLDSYLGEIEAARARARDARAAFEAAKAKFSDQQLAVVDHDNDYYGYGYGYAYDPEKYASWRARQMFATVDELDFALEVREPAHGLHVAPGPRLPPSARSGELASVLATKLSNPSELEWLARRDTRDVNRKLWDLALEQDGPGLVARLEERGLDGRGVVDFLGARQDFSGELARWVRYGYPAACTTCGVYPLANQIASRRDAALAAHADDVVLETATAARRLRELLLRRDIAIPLAVISELSPP